jgi:hypothetical protein
MLKYINSKIMNQSFRLSAGAHSFLGLIFLIISNAVIGQETSKISVPLPDNINKIVSASCMPCHSSNGGTLSKSKLNFTEWTGYSAEEQKTKAAKMYKELKKKEMPPKEAREKYPEIIPTKEQIKIIKAWADSF